MDAMRAGNDLYTAPSFAMTNWESGLDCAPGRMLFMQNQQDASLAYPSVAVEIKVQTPKVSKSTSNQ